MNATQQRAAALRTAPELRALAAEWEARARSEEGKTLANGWTSRELEQARQRAETCRKQRDLCLDAARYRA